MGQPNGELEGVLDPDEGSEGEVDCSSGHEAYPEGKLLCRFLQQCPSSNHPGFTRGYRGDGGIRLTSPGARKRLTCTSVVGLPGFEPGTS